MNPESYGFERRGTLLIPEIVITKPEGLLYWIHARVASVLARMGVLAG